MNNLQTRKYRIRDILDDAKGLALWILECVAQLLWALTWPLRWPFRSLLRSSSQPLLSPYVKDEQTIDKAAQTMDLEYARLLARTPGESQHAALDQLVLRITGRRAESERLPNLETLLSMAFKHPELIEELEARAITPDNLRIRFMRDGGDAIQAIDAKIESLVKLKSEVNNAFVPAYRAAYDALTREFSRPRHILD